MIVDIFIITSMYFVLHSDHSILHREDSDLFAFLCILMIIRRFKDWLAVILASYVILPMILISILVVRELLIQIVLVVFLEVQGAILVDTPPDSSLAPKFMPP